jgi:hypothetical protein
LANMGLKNNWLIFFKNTVCKNINAL